MSSGADLGAARWVVGVRVDGGEDLAGDGGELVDLGGIEGVQDVGVGEVEVDRGRLDDDIEACLSGVSEERVTHPQWPVPGYSAMSARFSPSTTNAANCNRCDLATLCE